MNKTIQKLMISTLALVMMISFSGCSRILSVFTPFDADGFVQSALDAAYKGDVTEYSKFLHIDEEVAKKDYTDAIAAEVNTFAQLYNIQELSENMRDQLTKLYTEIYTKASYEVAPETKKDGVFFIEVTVNPIDLFQISFDEIQTYVKTFNERVVAGEFNETEPLAYEDAYAQGIVDICKKNLDKSGYLQQKSAIVRIKKDEADDLYYLVEEDFLNLDQLIIEY